MADSITRLDQPKSYVAHALERVSFKSVTNLALSGAKWCNTAATVYNITQPGGAISDDNSIWNQYNVLKARVLAGTTPVPDVIYIPAGTNDMTFPLGSVATTFTPGSSIIGNAANTILNVADAVRFVVELILHDWPLVQVILGTPMQRGITDNSSMRNIGDVIEGCANMLSVKCIRLDKISGIYGYNEIAADVFLYDNLHPNEAGALKLGQAVAKELLNKVVS